MRKAQLPALPIPAALWRASLMAPLLLASGSAAAATASVAPVAVPEPASFALLTIGITVSALAARRRR
jgi:hypothetical protein